MHKSLMLLFWYFWINPLKIILCDVYAFPSKNVFDFKNILFLWTLKLCKIEFLSLQWSFICTNTFLIRGIFNKNAEDCIFEHYQIRRLKWNICPNFCIFKMFIVSMAYHFRWQYLEAHFKLSISNWMLEIILKTLLFWKQFGSFVKIRSMHVGLPWFRKVEIKFLNQTSPNKTEDFYHESFICGIIRANQKEKYFICLTVFIHNWTNSWR